MYINQEFKTDSYIPLFIPISVTTTWTIQVIYVQNKYIICLNVYIRTFVLLDRSVRNCYFDTHLQLQKRLYRIKFLTINKPTFNSIIYKHGHLYLVYSGIKHISSIHQIHSLHSFCNSITNSSYKCRID